ncbi:MAG: WD40 repeat domain-containing protein [Desulfobulbaceae bacterium]|nr:WD40 repeat domain-containing protein [Desulfobulbaceae bacterium]HIJ90563.1 WD40 repeat domain-containing protein [Deltaproteobacteria bacterium]
MAKGATKKPALSSPGIAKKRSALLSGLSGQAEIDYSPLYNLTVAAADDQILVWKLPDTVAQQEINSGEGFQALTLRFIPTTSLVVVGGMTKAYAGSIRFFDAATGNPQIQIDEPEPILYLDPHPAGRYLLATCETYIKVLDMKNGNTVAIMQKSTPTARGYYYGNGQYVLQSDTLALFDLKKRSVVAPLDAAKPLLFKKGLDGVTFSWVSAEGVTVVPAAGGGKKFYPLDTNGISAFDIEANGAWGIFLLDTQKLAVIDLAAGKIVRTIETTLPVADVTFSADGSSVYLQHPSGSISVYDIGLRNIIKGMQVDLAKLFGAMKSKFGPAAKPETKQ